MTQGLLLALQFLTRLPVRGPETLSDDALSRSSGWFPLVGGVIGLVVAAMFALGATVDPWLGALLGWIGWIWITGALHLDGLADLADALGAAHRDRARFLEVLRDPHVGTFGVIVLIIATGAKLVLLGVAARNDVALWFAAPLIAAWARLGAVTWSLWVPPLARGMGERFAWRASVPLVAVWTIALLLASGFLAPALVLAPLALLAWALYLKRKLGGMTGDCLGAGIELCEIALLAGVVTTATLTA
jgi:adenosylcobinamide-GDP ribazoletransferase